MAVFNEILSGRFNRAVQKQFGMKGPPPTPQLASEIIPVHPFLIGNENRYLESWNTYGVSQPIGAGGAGLNGIAQIRNLVSSAIIVVVTRIVVGGTLADQPILSYSRVQATAQSDLASLSQPPALDNRQTGNSNAHVSSTTIATASKDLPNLVMQGFINPSQQWFDFLSTDIHELSLGPGSTLRVSSNVANQTVTIGFMWRERALEEAELSLGGS